VDWDWFFSSLAQSVAAIVAIFSGFIINKILANQASFAAASTQIHQILADSNRLKSEADALYFDWYNERYNERELDDLEGRIQSGELKEPDGGWNVDTLLKEIALSKYSTADEGRQLIRDLIDKLEEQRRQEDEVAGQWARTFSAFASPIRRSPIAILPLNAKLMEMLNEERDRIDEVYRSIKHHMRLIKNLQGSIEVSRKDVPSIRLWLLLVVLLFLIGVIYPLSFLPTLASAKSPPVLDFSLPYAFSLLCSLRGFLLFLVSLAFITVAVIFAHVNEGLTHPVEDLSELSRFCTISSYSNHYAALELHEERRRSHSQERG
jgi:hypothetical protein